MPPLSRLVAAIALSVLVAGSAFADIVKTKSGKTYTGKIVESNARHVKIKTKFAGVVTIPRGDVASEKVEASKEDDYAEKLAKLADDDADGHYALATWCKENKLFRQYRAQLERVVAIAPDHADARKALGHVRDGDEWVTRSELAKREKARRAAKKAAKKAAAEQPATDDDAALAAARKKRGLVLHDGKWVPEAIVAFAKKGMVLHDGEWLRPKDVEERAKDRFPLGKKRWGARADADEYHNDLETPWVVHGTGFELHSNAARETVDKVKHRLNALDAWLERFFLGQRPGKRIKVWLYADAHDYNAQLEELRRESDAFAFHSGSIGGVYHPRLEAVTTYAQEEWGHIFLAHGYGEAFCRAMLDKGAEQLWFTLGVGHYLGMGRIESEPFHVAWVADLTKNRLLPLTELLGKTKLDGGGSGGNFAADRPKNEAFYAQSAALVYVMLRDRRFAEAFATARKKIVAGSATPSDAIRGAFDLDALETALRKRIDLAAAIREPAK